MWKATASQASHLTNPIPSLDELHLAQRPFGYQAGVQLTRLERCSFKKTFFLPDVF